VSYLEGCTAPMRDETSSTRRSSNSSRSTTRESNTRPSRTGYPGDENGKGGIYNFVTKRGLCKGRNSKISWTQVETGSAITWKYPSCVLLGDNSIGEFLFRRGDEQLSTGRHRHEMTHIGKKHAQHDCLEGHFRRPRPETAIAD